MVSLTFDGKTSVLGMHAKLITCEIHLVFRIFRVKPFPYSISIFFYSYMPNTRWF